MRHSKRDGSRLLGLLRLLVVVLAVQLSGSAPAFARAARTAATWLRADTGHSCCAKMAKARRAEIAAAKASKTSLCLAPDCCGGDEPCADCQDGCGDCRCGRDARSLVVSELSLVSRTLAAERMAAHAPAYASPFTPDLPRIYRPPCA